MNAIAEQEVATAVADAEEIYSGMCATCQDRAVCVFRSRMQTGIVCCEEYVADVND